MAVPIVRLSWAASWRGGRTTVIRALLLTVAAAGATVALGCVVSAVGYAQRVTERMESRSFVPASEGETAAFRTHAIFDATLEGDQIYVYWVDPLEDAPQIPGLPAEPAVGSWFISPALAEAVKQDPRLDGRFPDAKPIGNSGVGQADELVAYRIVGDDVALTDAWTSRTHEDAYLGDAPDIEARATALVGVVLVGPPALGMLIAGMAPGELGLQRRRTLLRALGAPTWANIAMIIVATTFSVLPGVAIGAGLWSVAAARMQALPLVGRSVLRGDFALSPLHFAFLVASVLVASSIAALTRVVSQRVMRPTLVGRRPLSTTRLAPLAAGVVLCVAGSGLIGKSNKTIFFAGVIAMALGSAILLPLALVALGRSIDLKRSVTSLLVGRRLVWNARTSARTVGGLCALGVLLPLGTTWINANRASVREVQAMDDPQPVWLNGEVPSEVEERITHLTDAVRLQIVGYDSADSVTLDVTIVGDCEPDAVLVFRQCGLGGGGLTDVASARLSKVTPFITPDSTIHPDAPAGTTVLATVFLGQSWIDVDEVVRTLVANADRTLPQVGYTMDTTTQAPVVGWVLGALSLATIATVAALAIRLAALSVSTAEFRRRLLALGASTPLICSIAAAESALPVLAAGFLALLVGTLVSALYCRIDRLGEPPFVVAGLASGVIVVVALVGAVASIAVVLVSAGSRNRE